VIHGVSGAISWQNPLFAKMFEARSFHRIPRWSQGSDWGKDKKLPAAGCWLPMQRPQHACSAWLGPDFLSDGRKLLAAGIC